MTDNESRESILNSTESRESGRHKCRPVHPECAVYRSRYDECTCEFLWGLSETLDPSPLPVYDRLDKRTKWGRHLGDKGPGPDAEDMLAPGDVSSLGIDAYESGLTVSNEIDGFWKESEFRSQLPEQPTKIDNDEA